MTRHSKSAKFKQIKAEEEFKMDEEKTPPFNITIPTKGNVRGIKAINIQEESIETIEKLFKDGYRLIDVKVLLGCSKENPVNYHKVVAILVKYEK